MKNILQKIFYPSQRGKIWRIFILIIILSIGCSIIAFDNYYNQGLTYLSQKINKDLPKVKEKPFSLGLDLQGGTHLVYKANMSNVSDKENHISALEGVRDVIERRVNAFGVSEPIVQTSISDGEPRLIVELAGIQDVNQAIGMIGETPLLEFKEQGPPERELTEDEKNRIKEFNDQSLKTAIETKISLDNGDDFKELAKQKSQDEKTKELGGDLGWVNKYDQSAEIRNLIEIVQELKKGEISDLEKSIAGHEIVKLEDKKEKKDLFTEEVEKEIKASHILICHNEAKNCNSSTTKEQAKQKIDELKKKVTPENFAQLAQENSTGPSANKGGDLGWFARDMMLKPFSDAVFDYTKVDEISFVVETEYGYHLIYKQEEKPITEYKLSHILLRTITEEQYLNSLENWKNTKLTGQHLERASVNINQLDGSLEISLKFNKEGAELFADVTERNIGKPVAIFLDGYIISQPNVNEKIPSGSASISGKFSQQEAQLLAQRLNAGALPVPIELINQKTVGPSLGQKSLDASLKAGILGLILVAIFMIIYYRLAGLLAVISLGIYGILILAIFKILAITLTLAGLAGLILSIGMAVDANVLIFERLREELKNNEPISYAIENAFQRAWSSIRDGNFSTIITCLILIIFTTSIIKGFAITLIIGVLLSMFSAVYITKTLLQLFFTEWVEKRKWLI